MSKLDEAIVYATDMHAGQKDKSGEPYILHALRVMLAMPDELGRIVGVLHDVVEDTDVKLCDIELMFGKEVRGPVDAMTRRPDEPYFDYIMNRVDVCPVARRVKVADLKDNLSPMRGCTIPQSQRERYLKALLILTDEKRHELALAAGG